MVLSKYAHTSIKEDLLLIENTYSQINSDNLSELPIVDLIPTKPGLDDINGKYILDGGVTIGKVTTRKKTGSKVGEIAGYVVLRLACDDEGNVLYDDNQQPKVAERLLVSKPEGLMLVQFMGAKNSYIRTRVRNKYDDRGQLLQTKTTAHLQPYPPKSEAFLRDGKIVTVYHVDDYGERKIPIELNIKREECTLGLWNLIQADYVGKQKRQKVRKSATEVKHEQDEKLKQLRKSLVLQNRSVINPFDTK